MIGVDFSTDDWGFAVASYRTQVASPIVRSHVASRQDKTRYISDRTGYGFRNTFIYIYM